MVVIKMWNVCRRLHEVVQIHDTWQCWRCHAIRKGSRAEVNVRSGTCEVDIIVDVQVVVFVPDGSTDQFIYMWSYT